jgi:branched-chain amino acid transport system ATP-binding protein
VTGVPILAVEEVFTSYGLSQVLFGVSLEVAVGECVCLLGRNGVGKTTTIRSVMGLTPPREGRVVWKGRDIAGRQPYEIAALGIGFVPEDRRIFADLTVWENLDVAARSRVGTSAWTLERVFDLFPQLRELVDRQGGFLSGGEQQMLTIARTLMGNPELLLLDEPSEGLAPLVVDHLKEQIARLKRDGLTILLAEQNVDFSLDLADRVYVLEKGHIRYEGTAASFRKDESIRAQYLAL